MKPAEMIREYRSKYPMKPLEVDKYIASLRERKNTKIESKNGLTSMRFEVDNVNA